MTEPSRGSIAPPRLVGALLVALLLLTAGLRIWDAVQEPNGGRQFDERFCFKNVTTLLVQHELEPKQAFYPSLSYLPQTGALWLSESLSRWTGARWLSVFATGGDEDDVAYSPTAYILVRLFSVAYALLSVWLTYRLGKRIFSPEAGLVAAAILAATQRHIVSSAQFKPDMLVVLLAVVCFGWALDAAVRPRLGRYVRAGAGVGLAVAAKYTGVATALPVAMAGLWRGWRDRRQWLWLVVAGLVSVVVFVALNPYVMVVLKFVPKLVHGYDAKGESEGSGHGLVFQQQIEFLIEHQGWAVTIFLAIGLIGMLALARRADLDPDHRFGAGLLFAQVVGYSLLHSGFMNLFRAQNYMPVAPFTALIAAWAMVATWRALAGRAPADVLRRPAASGAMLCAVTLFFLARQGGIVYGRVVPFTWDATEDRLTAVLPADGPRYVAFERGWGALQLPEGPELFLRQGSDRLAAVETTNLDLVDAEVFPLSRLDGPNAADYRQRLDRVPGSSVLRIEARWLATQGPGFAIVLHPWTAPEGAKPLAFEPTSEPEVFRAELPALGPGETASLVLWVPRMARRLAHLRLVPSGEFLELEDLGRVRNRHAFATHRLRLPAGTAAVELRDPTPSSGGDGVRLDLWRWRPPVLR